MIGRRLAERRSEVAVFAGGVLLPLGIFAALGVAVAGEGVQGWEAPIFDLTERYYRGPIGASLNWALEFGRALAAAILLAALILLLKRGRLREALFCLLAVGGVLAFDVPLKEMFHRPQWSGSRL
jgi:hypothetical protein